MGILKKGNVEKLFPCRMGVGGCACRMGVGGCACRMGVGGCVCRTGWEGVHVGWGGRMCM